MEILVSVPEGRCRVIAKSLKWESSFCWKSLLIAICWTNSTTSLLPAQVIQSRAASLQQRPSAPKFALLPPTRFDVVSIRLDKDGERFMDMSFTADGFTLKNLSLEVLLKNAFGIQEDHLLNVPGWAKNERFYINAKLTDPNAPRIWTLTKDQRNQLLLSLLEDRFGLKYHHETKRLQEYALRITKDGPKLKPSNLNHSGADGALGTARQVVGYGRLDAQGITVSRLITGLEVVLGSSIVDETGLTGNYDVALRWTPDFGRTPISPAAESAQSSSIAASSTDQLGPSLFTALKEQLGLELKSTKGAVDVVVIDHIEQPSPN